jgi:hypothetical protein
MGLVADNRLRLLNSLISLGEDELDVARVGHVGVDLSILLVSGESARTRPAKKSGKTYAAVGTVCPAALLGGLVDLNVLDDQVAGVEALGIGVRLSVLEEAEQELGRLDGPPSTGDTPLLACCPYQSAPDSTPD